MYNLQPGQGLGFTGSREIAFGLGWVIGEVQIPEIDIGDPGLLDVSRGFGIVAINNITSVSGIEGRTDLRTVGVTAADSVSPARSIQAIHRLPGVLAVDSPLGIVAIDKGLLDQDLARAVKKYGAVKSISGIDDKKGVE